MISAIRIDMGDPCPECGSPDLEWFDQAPVKITVELAPSFEDSKIKRNFDVDTQVRFYKCPSCRSTNEI